MKTVKILQNIVIVFSYLGLSNIIIDQFDLQRYALSQAIMLFIIINLQDFITDGDIDEKKGVLILLGIICGGLAVMGWYYFVYEYLYDKEVGFKKATDLAFHREKWGKFLTYIIPMLVLVILQIGTVVYRKK